MHRSRDIVNRLLGSLCLEAVSLKGGVAIATLIAGKEIAMMHGHLAAPKSQIVVVYNPPFFASTQVKNVPHLGHLGPMASSEELIAGCENSEHNCSCTLLFLRVGEDEMFDDRIMERAHLLNGRVDPVKENRVWIPTRIRSFARF